MNQSTFENKILPWIVSLWFLVAINSFFLWWSFGRVFRFAAFFGMLISAIILSKKAKVSFYNLIIFLSLLFYLLWLFQFFGRIGKIIRIIEFIPFFLLLFWPKENLNNCYKLLRKIIIFFAIGSRVVSVLSLVGVLQYLPHFTLEGRSMLHQSRGIEYYVYGAFLTLNGTARACGPVQEPGHWAVIVGLVYLIDRFALQKRNFWMVLGGVLTFSSAFLVMFLATELLNLFSNTSYKQTKQLIFALIGLLIVYFVLPQTIKDEFNYLFFERNLESVYENYDESGSIEGALDARANTYAISQYQNLTTNSFIFGSGIRDTSSALSDYRGTIMYMGLIGLILSIIPSVLILTKAKWRLFIALGVSLFLVYLHRGWMFFSCYIFFLAFMAVSLSSMPVEESDNEEEEDENYSNNEVVLEDS
jgi:hypothetical protein